MALFALLLSLGLAVAPTAAQTPTPQVISDPPGDSFSAVASCGSATHHLSVFNPDPIGSRVAVYPVAGGFRVLGTPSAGNPYVVVVPPSSGIPIGTGTVFVQLDVSPFTVLYIVNFAPCNSVVTTTTAPPSTSTTVVPTTTTVPPSTTTTVATGTSTTSPLGGTGATVSPNTANPGQAVTIAGGGFAGDQTLNMTFESTPVALGTTHSDAVGSFRATVIIPAGATLGVHHIVVSGPGAGGGTRQVVGAITIRSGAGRMPFTGFSAVELVAVAAWLCVAGALVIAKMGPQENLEE